MPQCFNCQSIATRMDCGHPRCEACFSDRFCECTRCGVIVPIDELSEDDGLCSECYTPTLSNLHEADYKPRPIYYGDAHDAPFLGIESENENESGIGDDPLNGLTTAGCYLKEDGSLESGMEIVTHPATWQYISSHRQEWNAILAHLRFNGWQSHNGGRCGLHIHISRKNLTSIDIYKIQKLIYEHADFSLRLSRRSAGSLRQWSTTSVASKDFAALITKKMNAGRYLALNTNPTHTVELRLFRGTLKQSAFWASVEFAAALTPYVKSTSIAHISPTSLAAWVEARRKTYQNLHERLQQILGSPIVLQPEEEGVDVCV